MHTYINLQHTCSKRGGVKGRFNNVKKNALLAKDGFPYLDCVHLSLNLSKAYIKKRNYSLIPWFKETTLWLYRAMTKYLPLLRHSGGYCGPVWPNIGSWDAYLGLPPSCREPATGNDSVQDWRMFGCSEILEKRKKQGRQQTWVSCM